MTSNPPAGNSRENAREPDDLGRLFVERVNARDLDGLVELYEPDAAVSFPPGQLQVGHAALRETYRQFLDSLTGPLPPSTRRPTLQAGDLALTSVRVAGGAITAEVARRQPDGTWRWVLDDPDVTR